MPRLAAERVLRREPALYDAPLAVLAEERQTLRVRSLNVRAQAAGARRGMGAADARALCPELVTRPDDPHADARALEGLLRWARRYSPWVGLDRDAAPGEGGLALDITGCAHLFGGEAALLADLLDRLGDMGLSARAAAADAKGAAWALARHGPERAVAPPGASRAAISDLPIAALRLAPQTVARLNRLGVSRIADLLALPRAALARRFGKATLQRLDQALGGEPEPVSPERHAHRCAARLSLPEPIGTISDVRAGLDRLLARLCHRLADAGMGARRLCLTVRHVDREERLVEIGLARPSRDPERIAPLFDRGVEALEAGFGIDALHLAATIVEPLGPVQAHAGPGAADPRARDALDELVTRLGGRLGFERVARPQPADTHNPDRATMWAAAAHAEPDATWAAAAAARPPRPLTRFSPEPIQPLDPGRPPERFRWRGVARTAAHATGPERLAPEWWFDDPAWRAGVRDYWRVQLEEGLRLWLFETPQADPAAPRWWTAGRFD